ncbi:hypothetical protein COI41_30560 [Bacillus toyonensis]|jgi:hypothetical protein|uniref:DUF4358 domain-containing protein n=2 Tax=Bacillus toyonensis TaxID=155322 RepID=UPI000BEC1FC7|nr:DUF4358 domain-containing protein [Bacillus toyonensis]MDF9450215.1 DUF4358 domain-containing protein [Bacillus toyonensis]MDG1564909.1 DUF4358 domain-containing protein [Bacillus toyonensis]PDY84197.1 hypothetical protein CON67_29550 [Bacillus toyonensis]PEO55494.1 hypothetical protein CN567_30015 [Bacillus toyonensis]PFX76708.1 hypothetical protein COL38_27930 [Bacillus toyonensis]
MINLLKLFNIKFVITIIVCTITLGALSGCFGKKENVNNLSATEIGEKIKQVANLEEMKKGDSKKLQKLYNINTDEIESFVLYTAPTNIKADEIATIKVKDMKNVKNIKEKILSRIEKKSKSFKDYLPDEYFLIEKHVLKTKDNYILLAISKDADKIEKTFDKILK